MSADRVVRVENSNRDIAVPMCWYPRAVVKEDGESPRCPKFKGREVYEIDMI